jgi:ABC-type antimicrobial peptide transport system permease subunit
MDDIIGESIAPQRLNFVLVSAFAFVALVLTAAGLYGVMAYVVAQRTREIGVRMALGATRGQVLRLMFQQAGTLTGIGIGLGIAGALLLTRSMTSLFGVSAADPRLRRCSRCSQWSRCRCSHCRQGHAHRSAVRAPHS